MTATTRAARHKEGSPQPPDRLEMNDNASPRPSRRTSSSKATSTSAERPVRRQLKNTSITAPAEGTPKQDSPGDASSETGSAGTDSSNASPEAQSRGRPAKKKRSFEEVDPDTTDSKRTVTSKLRQKRSRSNETSEPIAKSHDAHEQPAIAPGETVMAESTAAETIENVEDEKESEAITAQKTSKDTIGNIEGGEQHEVTPAQETSKDDAPVVDAFPQRPQTPVEEHLEAVEKTGSAAPASPQMKRRRETLESEQSINENVADTGGPPAANAITDTTTPAGISKISTAEEPDRKKTREESFTNPKAEILTPSANLPASSAFSNASAQSPFGTLAASKSSDSQSHTSPKAFASSGFASFASTSQSAFGSLEAEAATDEKKTEPQQIKLVAATSGFAALSGSQSAFASAKTPFGNANGFGSTTGFGSMTGFGSTTGFGGLSNGFAKPGSGPPLSSFASANGGVGIISSSSKPAKAFGAPADDDEEDEGETSEPEDHAIKPADDGPKDPRFFEQDVETGEEGEQTIYSSRAKLYVNTEKQWKERCVGVFKVNLASGPDGKSTARFIMRADGSHRISLNSKIAKEFKITDPAGGPPNGRNAVFLGFIDGVPTLMQLKMKTNQQMNELYKSVTYVQQEM